jgi:hypothetical protein
MQKKNHISIIEPILKKYVPLLTNQYLISLQKNIDNITSVIFDDFSNQIINDIADSFSDESISSKQIEFELKDNVPELKIALPDKIKIIPDFHYAIAAVIGVFIGGIYFTRLFQYVGIKTEMIFISNILGAFLTTFFYGNLSKLFSKVAGLLGKKSDSNFKMPPKKSVYNAVHSYLNLWLFIVTYIADDITASLKNKNKTTEQIKHLPVSLIDKIYKLSATPLNQLKTVATEIIQEAKLAGFQGFDEIPVFKTDKNGSIESQIWSEDMKDKFDVFGRVNVGDKIIIEEKPKIINDKIIKKGLVRKIKN